MALMHVMSVAVKKDLLEGARIGDADCIQKLKERLHDEELYFHAMPVEKDEEIVTITDLILLGVVSGIKLKTNPEGRHRSSIE